MKQPLTVHIADPCHEQWSDMTPTARGAHCAACQKEVIDFTYRTDHYIYQTLLGRTDMCGRFLSTQVGRPIEVAQQPLLPSYLRRIAATVVSVFTLYKATAEPDQMPRIDTATLQVDTTRHLSGDTIVSEPRRPELSGYVRDRETDCPIASASIRIVGSSLTAYTDIDGYFAFDTLPPWPQPAHADTTGYQADSTHRYTWVPEEQDTSRSASAAIRLLVKNGGYAARYITLSGTDTLIDIDLQPVSYPEQKIEYVTILSGMVSTPVPDPVPDPTVVYSDAYLPGPRVIRTVPQATPRDSDSSRHMIYAERFTLWLRSRREALQRWTK